MSKSRFKGINTIVGLTGAAVLSTVFTQHLSSRQSETGSETLCWILLPVLFTITQRSDISPISRSSLPSNVGSQHTSSSSLWIVAAGISIACGYKAEIGTIVLLVSSSNSPMQNVSLTNCLQPALTPLLMIAEKHIRPELHATSILELWHFSFITTTVFGTSLTALFAIFAASDWDLRDFALSTIPLVALLLVYVAFIPRTKERTRYLARVNLEEDIFRLSMVVAITLAAILSIQAVAFGLPTKNVTHTLVIGLAKALSWFFTIQTVRGLLYLCQKLWGY